MVSFYERLRKGFPASIHVNGNVDFAYKTLLKNFYAANPMLKVCPACDGQRPHVDPKTLDLPYDFEDEDANAGKSDVQIDHFFPKADYPFFAVHFMNLVPLCRNCNLDKQETNPLGHCSGKGALQHTFLPFLKPAIECIEVKVTRTRHLQPKVVLLDTQLSTSQRAKNLNATFGLSAKWEQYLGILIEEKMAIFANKQDAQQRDRKRVKRRIKNWLKETGEPQRELFGQVANLIVQKGYAAYALNNHPEIEVLVGLVMNRNAPPPPRPSQTPGLASIPILPE